MKRSFMISAASMFVGFALASTNAFASPSATPAGLNVLSLLNTGQAGIHQVHLRNTRHCHKRRRTCRTVTLDSGKKVRRCTTRPAFCHGAAPHVYTPRGSH